MHNTPTKLLCRAVLCCVMQTAYKPAEDNIVTAASCTTNCLAPVVKVTMRSTAALLAGSTLSPVPMSELVCCFVSASTR